LSRAPDLPTRPGRGLSRDHSKGMREDAIAVGLGGESDANAETVAALNGRLDARQCRAWRGADACASGVNADASRTTVAVARRCRRPATGGGRNALARSPKDQFAGGPGGARTGIALAEVRPARRQRRCQRVDAADAGVGRGLELRRVAGDDTAALRLGLGDRPRELLLRPGQRVRVDGGAREVGSLRALELRGDLLGRRLALGRGALAGRRGARDGRAGKDQQQDRGTNRSNRSLHVYVLLMGSLLPPR